MPISTTTPAKEAVDAIASLHTRSIDAAEGFEVMIDKAEPDFLPVAQQFHALHRNHAAQLHAMLVAYGVTPDDDGSFMGTINRAVVTVRAFLDEIDDDVMGQVRSGEDAILDAFDEARKTALPAKDLAAVVTMKAELTDLLARTAHLD